MFEHTEKNNYTKKIALRNGQELNVRRATENDAKELIELMKLMDGETKFLAREPEEFKLTVEQEVSFLNSINNNPNAMFIVAELDGKIVGNCSVSRISNTLRYRHRASMGIAVRKSNWGLGIGREMMHSCIVWCEKNGIEQLELEVVSENGRAISMYESLGFIRHGIKKNALKYSNGEYADEYFMILDLSSHDNKYQEKSKNKEPGELAKKLLHYIPKNSTILDLGAGAGVDSRYFADNGHCVTAIDRETAVITKLIEGYGELYTGKITVIKDDFYHMTLPICDAIYANYSFPFCETIKFPDKWSSLESQVKIGAVIAFIFFGVNDDWKNYTEKFTFHSSEDVQNLLENYEIIHLENKEYDGQSMRPSGEIIDKHWNVIEVIAKKIK